MTWIWSKGRKEWLIPIGQSTARHIRDYLAHRNRAAPEAEESLWVSWEGLAMYDSRSLRTLSIEDVQRFHSRFGPGYGLDRMN
jgi:site-specific recombinase XerC